MTIKYTFQPITISPDLIELKEIEKSENLLGKEIERVVIHRMNLMDAQVRNALIALGWTPPASDSHGSPG